MIVFQTCHSGVPFTCGAGGIFVLQDNVPSHMTDKKEIAEAWKTRMINRAGQGDEEGLNLEFKEKDGSKLPEIEIIEDGNETEFCGIKIGYGWWSTLSKQERADPFEVIEKKKQEYFTHREIAAMLGEKFVES